MKSKFNEQKKWQDIFSAWVAFNEKYPHLGYARSVYALRRFLGQHANTLEALGVITKVNGRRWLASIEHFDDAAFAAAVNRLPQDDAA